MNVENGIQRNDWDGVSRCILTESDWRYVSSVFSDRSAKVDQDYTRQVLAEAIQACMAKRELKVVAD